MTMTIKLELSELESDLLNDVIGRRIEKINTFINVGNDALVSQTGREKDNTTKRVEALKIQKASMCSIFSLLRDAKAWVRQEAMDV